MLFDSDRHPAARSGDQTLAIALAEYQHLREMRIANRNHAGSELGQLFLGASVIVAAIATIFGVAGVNGQRWHGLAVVSVCAALFGVGEFVYASLVYSDMRGYRYEVFLASLRTFMVERSPELRPYLLLPTLETDSVGPVLRA